MIIKNETVVTTTEVEVEEEIYTRIDTPLAIYWNNNRTCLFDCWGGKWRERVNCRMRDCDVPKLEIQYQRLKEYLWSDPNA